jgi:hypothetical protein
MIKFSLDKLLPYGPIDQQFCLLPLPLWHYYVFISTQNAPSEPFNVPRFPNHKRAQATRELKLHCRNAKQHALVCHGVHISCAPFPDQLTLRIANYSHVLDLHFMEQVVDPFCETMDK